MGWNRLFWECEFRIYNIFKWFWLQCFWSESIWWRSFVNLRKFNKRAAARLPPRRERKFIPKFTDILWKWSGRFHQCLFVFRNAYEIKKYSFSYIWKNLWRLNSYGVKKIFSFWLWDKMSFPRFPWQPLVKYTQIKIGNYRWDQFKKQS